jgi:hypothetical protein
MESNIGLLEILGEAIGVREETSDLSEELIILLLKAHAPGLLLSILGQATSEMKPNQRNNKLNLRLTLKTIMEVAKEFHLKV